MIEVGSGAEFPDSFLIREVFQLIGQGKGTREIAEHLHLSVKTVEVHRANIKVKLKLKSAPDLMHFAVRWVEAEGKN